MKLRLTDRHRANGLRAQARRAGERRTERRAGGVPGGTVWTLGLLGVLLGGWMLARSLPDLRRYLRLKRM